MNIRNALVLTWCALHAACLPTLPDPVYTGDSEVFRSDAKLYSEAQSCGTHLNSLRRSAKYRGYVRFALTIAAGLTTSVSGYVAATKASDDPNAAKTGAEIALTSGIIALFTQAIPDSSEALDKYRAASSSWTEARRLAESQDFGTDVFDDLVNCRQDIPSTPSVPTKLGSPL